MANTNSVQVSSLGLNKSTSWVREDSQHHQPQITGGEPHGSAQRSDSPDDDELYQRYLDHRYEAAAILLRNGHSCLIWAEDALKHYGVPTVCFDLLLLVDNVENAIQCLINVGYNQIRPNPRYERLFELVQGSPRLQQPSARGDEALSPTGLPYPPTYVVLLPANRWRLVLPPTSITVAPFPDLAWLVDSVIDVCLDATSSRLLQYMRTHLAYIYRYIAQVRHPLFVNKLGREHWEFHLAWIQKPTAITEQEKWRNIRDSHLR